MFGSGVIGQVTVPQILKDHGLLEYIDCYIDNNKDKWGTQIELFGNKYDVGSTDRLDKCPENTAILVNISRFYEVMEQLDNIESTRWMDCYIMPMMLIDNYCSGESDGEPCVGEDIIIPRKLHYMWLGGAPKPDKLKYCIDSWKKYCPDFEIIEWNEDNYDICKNPYMKEAYEAGAYGFVPDYARLDILYREGGIYLDTDVEIIRNIDPLLYQEAFCGVEKWQVINFGGMSGAAKGNTMIKEFLDAREDLHFIDSNGNQNRNTCGYYDTLTAIRAGYRINGRTQTVKGMNIYAYDHFHPYDYMSGILNKTANTYSIHWFNGGWLNEEMRAANEKVREKYESYCDMCESM